MTFIATPDLDAACDFLLATHEEKPIHLTAIPASGGNLLGGTFTSQNVEAMRRWIGEKNNKKYNIYWSIADLSRSLDDKHPKANKGDVSNIRYLHLDFDPLEGETPDDAKLRIMGILDKQRMKPTWIVDSGNGMNVLFALRPDGDLEVGGNLAAIEYVERFTRQLQIDCGGKVSGVDSVFNADRVLRCAGTVNWPSKKKLSLGRVPSPTKLIAHHPERVYSLTEFAAAPPLGKIGRPAASKAQDRPQLVTASGVGIGSEALQAWAKEHGTMIADSALAALVLGREADPEKYPSRSEALWHVCCGLARAGVPDELIVAAITDENNKAAECVLDKPSPSREAWAQVGKARAEVDREIRERVEAGDQDLAEMNRLHAVIVSGKVRVLSWRKTHPKIDRLAPDIQSFEDFANRYKHRRVTVGFNEKGQPVEKPKGRWWLENPLRREILGLCFEPGEGQDVDGFQNLWRGWGVEPRQGDWSLMREHVRTILASGDPTSEDYIIRWAAWAVQNPGKQAEAALVFKGGRGTGKGFFGRALKDLFGQHGLHIKSTKHLTGDFNLHLRDCCLLFADEALAPGDKGAEARLKGLITEPDLTIEGKGVDLVTEPNHLHVVMASNESWVVPAAPDERRFAVFSVSNANQQDETYFAALDAQLRAGGLAAMLFDLLNMELGDWHPRRSIPQTEALRAQKIESLDGFEAFAFDLLSTIGLPVTTTLSTGEDFIASEELRAAAAEWLKYRPGSQGVTHQRISQLMKLLGCKPYRRGNGGMNGFRLAPLSVMRSNWDVQRFPWSWSNDTEYGLELGGVRSPF